MQSLIPNVLKVKAWIQDIIEYSCNILTMQFIVGAQFKSTPTCSLMEMLLKLGAD